MAPNPNLGAHIVHIVHALIEETEHGGPLAGVGIAIGAVVGYLTTPLWQVSELCRDTGLGKDALGNCPQLFTPEALVTIGGLALFGGAVGLAIGAQVRHD
ncbi:MAG: hypothetical protein QOJ85_1750 [Solirubrobacteraceae bacterium]|jgi:hypothetical protein|nr:hypothetical protein [Solirubrobacteraceae bacterium]